MKRNELIALIIVAALAMLAAACGGGTEPTNANSSVGVNNNSNLSGPNTAVTNNTAVPDNTAAPSDATTKNTGRNAPVTKDPTPQIGTGGNDMYLFTKTRGALNSDNELKSANIIISLNAGVVTLTGKVANDAQKAKAEQLVRSVEGVTSVKNQLTVSSGGAKR